jgi:hypothetical protein
MADIYKSILIQSEENILWAQEKLDAMAREMFIIHWQRRYLFCKRKLAAN